MSNVNLNRVYSNMAARGNTPQVSIQSHVQIGPSTFKVVAAVFGVESEADLSEAVASLTDGRGRLVPGSFNRRGRICVGAVAANAQSAPMDASFKLITASTALAADGRIWNVVNDNGAKRVVLESCDDLAEILAARQAARAIHANPVEGASLAVAHVSDGDLVRYVDVANNKTSWGFAVTTPTGLAIIGESLTSKIVAPEAIVASVPRSQVPGVGDMPVTAKLDSDKLSGLMQYLTKAWAPGTVTTEMLNKYRKLAAQAR